jgi:uncharacterized protein YhaN
VKIDRLHIDGFGVFHNKEIGGFSDGINLLYGPNEAGKSTLLDFVRFTLFDYPRFLDERRPPINGGKHGGRIWLKSSNNQPLSIYRNGNAKDLLINYKNEETSNINVYFQLIGNASIDLYKNVYAITLDELMAVQQLSDSGMEDRIFSMGMGLSGVDFGKFESGLVDHADNFFKARGRTQVLPELVDQIQQKEDSILQLKNKLGEYNRLSEQKENLENQLDLIRKNREELSEAKNKYADLSKAYPEFVEYQQARTILIEIGDLKRHSEKFLEQFEEAKKALSVEEQSLEEVKQKIDQLTKEKSKLEWDKALSEQASLLDYFKTTVKLYEEAKARNENEKEKLANAKSNKEIINKRLGETIQAEQLIALEGTFELQSQATETVEAQQKLERQRDTKKEVEGRLSSELDALKEKKAQFESKIDTHSIRSKEEREKANKERIELDTAFKQALENAGGNTKKSSKNPLILAFIFLLVGGALFFVNLIAGGLVVGVALVSLIVVLLTSKSNPVNFTSENPTEINKRIDKLNTAISTFDEFEEKKQEITQQLTSKEKEYNSVTEELESLNQSLSELDKKWKTLLENAQLPSHLSPQQMGDFISNVEEFKHQHRASLEAEKAIENNESLIKTFEDKMRTVAPDLKTIEAPIIYDLIGKIEKNEEEKRKTEELERSILQKTNEKDAVLSKTARFEEDIREVMTTLGVENEEELYKQFEQQKTYQEANEKQSNAAKNIRTLCGAEKLESTIDELEEYTPSLLNSKKEETEQDYEAIKNQFDEMNRELASITTNIRHILEPDEMYELQNNKESLETRLIEETKEWLSTKMALAILNESKQKYEAEKQPEVITQTREYFKAITENAYEDLRISLSEKHVSIIDSSGKAKTVEELSRGTREQLLLALRLGLIEEYEKNAEPLPVALDDIMVNFDVHRAENLAEVLTNFAKNRQVILFTCHEHTRDLFKEHGATVIDWKG